MLRLLGLVLLFTFAQSLQAQSDPENVALVDTGYDACMLAGEVNCERNKNLLIRGASPLPDDPPYVFNFENFRENIFSYLVLFKQKFKTNAVLPTSMAELKNYRIVVINLLYDFNDHGGAYELNELQQEFKASGQSLKLQIPEQHKMYGLDKPFDQNQYAFEWWPITFANLAEDHPEFISLHLNWPDRNGTPSHTFLPENYKVLNFPYLLNGFSYEGVDEPDAKDLRELLTSQPNDDHPLLIFYHCVAGKDRTGAVSAAYFMQFGGYPFIRAENNIKQRVGPVSLAQALIFTATTRPANMGSQKLSKAYCLFLKKSPEECHF